MHDPAPDLTHDPARDPTYDPARDPTRGPVYDPTRDPTPPTAPTVSRPVAPHAFSMTLEEGCFLHRPVDPAALRPRVPDPFELDTYDGRAWITVVPFVLARAGLRYSPRTTRLTVPECNVRTYVRYDDTPGLYFFSVDVASRTIPAIVRTATEISCFYAAIDVERDGSSVNVRYRRSSPGDRPDARLDGSYRPDGELFHTEPGSLDHWLAERRRMFDFSGGTVLYADIAHEPWPLQPAHLTLRADTLFEANGLPEPTGDPRIRYTSGLTLTGSIPRQLRSLDAADQVRPPELEHR